MKTLDNTKIWVKLIGGFILISILFAIVSITGIATINSIVGNSRIAYSDGFLPIQDLQSVKILLNEISRDTLRYYFFPAERTDLESTISTETREINNILTKYKASSINPSNQADFVALNSNWADYQNELQIAFMESKSGNTQYINQSLSTNGKLVNLRKELNNEADSIISGEEQWVESILAANEKDSANATIFVIIISCLGIISAIVIGFILTRNITVPLIDVMVTAEKIGRGESKARVNFDRKDELGDLGNSLNIMAGHIGALVGEAHELTKAAVKGELSVRADPSVHEGDYRAIITEFNATLDAVTGPLNIAAEYVDRISKGDIPQKITDHYNGDFNEIKQNLNTCIDEVKLLIEDVKMLSLAGVEGRLSTRADASRHKGDFMKIVEGVNETLDSVIGPLNVAAGYVDRISNGNIPDKITENYNGDFNAIKLNLNKCIDAVNLLISDSKMLSLAGVEGRLSTRADASQHKGDFRKIVEGVNETLDSVIGPLNVAAGYVDRISNGDIPDKITENYNGDFNAIKLNLNKCVDAVNLLISDSKMLSLAGVEGRLSTRADASRHKGDFRKIVEGVNETLDSVIGPVNEALRVSKEYARGDFTARVSESLSVRGDFIEFKDALNKIGVELSKLMNLLNEEIFEGVNVLSAASSEILAITAQLSAGANQTATSVNETTATVQEVRKTTDLTSEKSKYVAEKAVQVNQIAEKGQKSVDEIIAGMSHIQQQMEGIAGNVVRLSEQSQAIGEIIASVNDISEQSNLLAVNASIEAAKAGELGKGFGVVSQEIKNLADQSKQATSHIRTILTDIQRAVSSTVISTEQGTKTVLNGSKLSSEAQESIIVLSKSIADSSKAAIQITASVQEQVVGMDQIALAMESIREAAQSNLAVTKQAEKTAQNLHDLGLKLKQVAGRYKV